MSKAASSPIGSPELGTGKLALAPLKPTINARPRDPSIVRRDLVDVLSENLTYYVELELESHGVSVSERAAILGELIALVSVEGVPVAQREAHLKSIYDQAVAEVATVAACSRRRRLHLRLNRSPVARFESRPAAAPVTPRAGAASFPRFEVFPHCRRAVMRCNRHRSLALPARAAATFSPIAACRSCGARRRSVFHVRWPATFPLHVTCGDVTE